MDMNTKNSENYILYFINNNKKIYLILSATYNAMNMSKATTMILPKNK